VRLPQFPFFAKKKGGLSAAPFVFVDAGTVPDQVGDRRLGMASIVAYEHPVVDPQVSHFMQVPLRTRVKLPHSLHISPS